MRGAADLYTAYSGFLDFRRQEKQELLKHIAPRPEKRAG